MGIVNANLLEIAETLAASYDRGHGYETGRTWCKMEIVVAI